MSNDLARVIILLGFVVVLPIGVYHRLQARTGERLDRRQEGWLILLTLRPLAAVSMLGLLAFLIEPSSMAWASMRLPSWLRWIGVALSVAAGSLLTWTFRSLGKNLTDTVVTRRNATLITHGPYRWVRHPFYLAAAMAVIGGSLLSDSWFFAVTGSAVVAALVARTSIEEGNLIHRFGNEYLEYMQRTGRFLPRIRRRLREPKSHI
jgi:protein-S-isoprenylcysteine O-methyltransferase Ste14